MTSRLSGWAGLLVLLVAPAAHSYSILAHEAIIDSTWKDNIRPLLLERFPESDAEALRKAHAYAYGGSIIQDLGYYPFGSRFYSDLTHYVRSGDFIANMISDSQDLNEYAFSLGALAHFAADINGHSKATNICVPMLYPKLRTKFGNLVTYADDHLSHSKTEFGFDVYQAAMRRYAPDAYRDFIGFEVAKPILERAFLQTYGIKLEDVFFSVDLAIGTYRKAVGSVLPTLTKVAWKVKRQEILHDAPGTTRQQFLYNLSRVSYEKNWGNTYQRPGFGIKILAGLFRIVPKIGPLRAFAYHKQTPETERLFMVGFNASIDRYRQLLSASGRNVLDLPNDNCDVGGATSAGKYRLTDAAYAKLVHKLNDHYDNLPPGLRDDILAFYKDLSAPIATKKDRHEWKTLREDLEHLKAANHSLAASISE